MSLLLGLAYVVHFRALLAEVDRAAGQTRQLWAEQVEKVERVQALSASDAQRALAARALDASRWQLAADGETASLLEAITHQGQQHGVFIEQLELLPEVLQGEHVELPMQLQLRGSYPALAAFTQGLAQVARLITLQDFSLAPVRAQYPAQLRMQLHASAYRSERPGIAPLVAGSAVERPSLDFSRNPFEPAALQQHRQFLETLPIEQFELVGSIARQHTRFALLRVAGVVHRLQLGDRLGRDRGRIVAIEERQVEIVEEVFVAGKGWEERRRTLGLKAATGSG
ncbi:pilus assembly protein PilP [Pseudomonas sp. GD03860]|uniref:pilus assembly protein PilP n=1 Tax=Pseudomonas TaxID=286 RepID=UPI002363746A|nr:MULTISPECIES: pilus assembly protein PilP [Pseudomonas]MDD2059915.1 pilus assembly protein PilP [Pseudomonas putida]MDH0637130.1 pilus assembly protein PilP [Pseudomonas sp. GD03860]